jgi:hypothetical protein
MAALLADIGLLTSIETRRVRTRVVVGIEPRNLRPVSGRVHQILPTTCT